MEFEIEKSAQLIMRNLKQQMTEGVELPNQEKIRTPGEKETHNYLVMLEADTIKQAEMKKKLMGYLRRTRKLLEPKIYNRNLNKGMSCLAVSLERYSRLGKNFSKLNTEQEK